MNYIANVVVVVAYVFLFSSLMSIIITRFNEFSSLFVIRYALCVYRTANITQCLILCVCVAGISWLDVSIPFESANALLRLLFAQITKLVSSHVKCIDKIEKREANNGFNKPANSSIGTIPSMCKCAKKNSQNGKHQTHQAKTIYVTHMWNMIYNTRRSGTLCTLISFVN